MTKRLMALLLVLTMVVSMLPISAFAAEEEKLNYVSLGDSMTNGLGHPGYTKDGYLEVAPAAYPAKFAKWLEATKGVTVNLTQLATSASRAEDLHYILEVGQENAYPGDVWTYSELLGGHTIGIDGMDRIGADRWGVDGVVDPDVVETFQTAVTEADIITIAVGNGNFGVTLMDMLNQVIGLPGYGIDYSYATFENALAHWDVEEETLALVMDVYSQAKSYLVDKVPAAMVETMCDRIAYTVASYMINYNGALDRIVEMNPDVEIIVVALINNMTDYKLEITQNGETAILDMGALMNYILDPMNAYLAGLPAVKQMLGEYADATIYYAEPSEPIETWAQAIAQAFETEEGRDFWLSRIAPDVISFVFPMIGLDGSSLSVAKIREYRATGFEAYKNKVIETVVTEYVHAGKITPADAAVGNLGEYANEIAAKVTAIVLPFEAYELIEGALINSLSATPAINLDELTLPEGEFSLDALLGAILPEEITPEALTEGPIVALLSVYARMKMANGLTSHPSEAGHNTIFDAVKKAYSEEYTVQDETMKNTLETLEIAKDLVLEYYDEAYAYGYAYAADNGYIAMAQKGITDSIAAIKAIDLDATDMTEEFKAQLQIELDALVVTLEKLNAALAAGQFATVDGLVNTYMALENDLYTHLENIKNISLQAGSDVYELVVLPAIDYIYTVTIPQAKQAVQAVLDQAWQYIVTKIYEAYGIVIDINTSVTDMIDMVQTCIARKVAEAMGIIVDINATVQDIMNAIREHIEHITAGEIVLTEDFFYLAIEDSDFYAELVAEALKLSEDQYMEVTLDEVTPELLARADFITIGYNNMNSLYFGLYQIMGVANVYLQDAYEFIYTVDAKFDAAYPGMENSGIDLYTKAMDALYEQGGIYLWLVEGMELAELNWEALVGAESLPYIEEARAQMQAALVEAGVPATYPVSFDVVAEVLKMTKDYAPLDENALRNALGEHAVFSLDIPVADLAVFAVESVLYDYIAYNQNYSNTMMTINAINPDATVAALGNYSRLDLDYEFVIDEMSFVPAEVLAQFGFEGFVLPDEAKEALAAVAAMGIYEFDIPTTDAMEALLAQYNELAQYAVSFELPASEEAALLIADLVETANACVAYAAEQVEDVYTVTIPVTDLMNLAVEHGQQLDVLINASLNTEVVIASQTIQVNDILALLANLSSLHPFSYASAFGNVFYVDITGAQMGGMEYIADRILSALTITCAHTDHDNDHFCDLWCGIELSKCADNDADHFCDICGAELSKCADNDADHFCDVCDIRLSPCFDAQNDGNHACDYCGMANVTAHRYSAATCAAPGRCFECGVTSGSVLAHTEEIIPAVEATCTATGLTEGKKCSVCGKILVAQETVEKLAHTEEIIPAVEATCTATGLTEGKKCSVCGEILVAQETVEKLAHTEEVISAVDATCTATGLTEGKKCSVCGEILVAQETVEKLAHTEVSIPAVEATCTAAGKTEGKKCSVCGEILVAQEAVAKLAHTEAVIPAVEATCTAAGKTEGKKCSVCGEILVAQGTVAAKGHTEETIPATEATCTTAGKTEGKKCSVCGEILVAQETVAAKGHSFGEWSVSKEATRKEAGEETRSCACGETETREIPALGGANVGVIVGASVGGVGILAVAVFFLLKKKMLF